ncbi:MAG: DUF1097 domain-containing protein [Lachnospiraceae bacterium]|jgi:hypothetical protein
MKDTSGHCRDTYKCAFATAFLCMIWMAAAGLLKLPGWAGFAGCTAYFAAPGKGIKSLPKTFACVGSGILYASLSLLFSGIIPGQAAGLLLTFLTTFLMCAAGNSSILGFVPGAFIGSFSTFASKGDIRAIAAILIGVFLGLACDSFGKALCGRKDKCAVR